MLVSIRECYNNLLTWVLWNFAHTYICNYINRQPCEYWSRLYLYRINIRTYCQFGMFFTLVKIKNVYFKCIFYIMLGHEINEVRADFGDTFPGVIGAIDGTLIHIRCPSENKEAYNCRKRFYALNVQVQVFACYSRSKCHCFTLTVPATVYCIL